MRQHRRWRRRRRVRRLQLLEQARRQLQEATTNLQYNCALQIRARPGELMLFRWLWQTASVRQPQSCQLQQQQQPTRRRQAAAVHTLSQTAPNTRPTVAITSRRAKATNHRTTATFP
jgi:hypothetical protein